MRRPVEILDPRAERRPPRIQAARLPSSLQGARVGFLENAKPNADVVLGVIRDALVAQYGIQPVWHEKTTAGKPASPEAFRDLASCKLVITGSAD